MRKQMRSLKQVDLFTGRKVREKSNPVFIPSKTQLKQINEKKKLTRVVVRNFFENQLLLSIDQSVLDDVVLPVLPDDFLKKRLPAIVTEHRAMRVCEGLDDSLTVDQTRRKIHRFRWSDEDIVLAHREFLEMQLEILTISGFPNERLEILDWLFADRLVTWHGRKVKAEYVPFSYLACCFMTDLNHESLREGIFRELPVEYQNWLSANYRCAA